MEEMQRADIQLSRCSVSSVNVVLVTLCVALGISFVHCRAQDAAQRAGLPVPDESMIAESAEVAVFAAGCFWCVEECFMQHPGVLAVISGYAQGSEGDAVYKKVSHGVTDHTEAVEVYYDPEQIGFGDLVDYYWKIHDPTTLNRQGNDVGRQYRSGIYYRSAEQQKIAEASKAALQAEGRFSSPVVTEILPFKTFFAAEEYHQNYYRRNPDDRYCNAVLVPKLKKLGLKWVKDF